MSRQASIQLLRGTNAAIANNKDMILENGQPLYDKTLGLLYVGNGSSTMENLVPISVDFSKNTMEDLDISDSWNSVYQPPSEPIIIPLPEQTPITSMFDAFQFQTTTTAIFSMAGCKNYSTPFSMPAIGPMKDTSGAIQDNYSIICRLGNGTWDADTGSNSLTFTIQLTGFDRARHGPLDLYLIHPDATETLVATGSEDFYSLTTPVWSQMIRALQDGYLYFRVTASAQIDYLLWQPQRFIPSVQTLLIQ